MTTSSTVELYGMSWPSEEYRAALMDTLKDLPELIRKRDEALMIWQTVKRLQGKCVAVPDGFPDRSSAYFRTIGAIQLTNHQRADSLCTTNERPNKWCETCKPVFKYWRAFLYYAHRVHRLTHD